MSMVRNIGKINKQIAQTYGASLRGIECIRERFVLAGLKMALEVKKREIFPEKLFTGEVEPKLIALQCSESPEGYNHWTLQLLADKMVELIYVEHVSDESVR